MAAKKPTKKAAPTKSAKKPAPASKKADTAKESAPKKPAAPAKKPAPAKKAPAPAKKAVAEKSAPAKKVLPKQQAPAKAAPAVVAKPAKPTKPVSAKAEVKKAAPAKPAAVKKSSLVDYPVPPAPARAPFVPPKAAVVPSNGGGSGSGQSGHHSDSFIQKQKQRLLDLRDELVDAMSGMTRDTIRNAPEGSEASGSGQHQGDAGSDAYDRDFALSVLAKEQDALYEIEQALRRIKLGTYGVCEMSSKKIPQARLEAIPFARLTVECQAQWEKEYGKTRFRPSNEVGFSGGAHVDDEDSETVSLDDEEE